MPVSKNKDFTQIESDEICRFRASGKRLRNRALNLGHSQPSSLDAVIPVEDQQSWVLGNGPYNLHGAREGVVSMGGSNELVECFCGGAVAEGGSGAVVQFVGDGVEVGLVMGVPLGR